MNATIPQERVNLTLGFLRIAYNDYIAARVLLIKNYTLQGIILASTAIEKYFKAAVYQMTGRKLHVHMDKFEKIEKEVVDIGYQVLIDKIDRRFIETLSKAYMLRYYDNITVPVSIGFFKNQFLGELDSAIALFERLFILKNAVTEETMLSPLRQDLKKGNPDLYENNWATAENKDKKAFMETGCEGFAVFIHPGNLFEEINVSSVKMNLPYDGQMMLINVKPDKEIVF